MTAAMPIGMHVAVLLLCAASVSTYPINHDVAWLLALAERVRDGARLYVDVLDVSPPLIVWLKIPVCAAAELAAIEPGTVFRCATFALAAGSAMVAARVFGPGLAAPWVFLASIAAAGYDFGQREHLAFLLCLPYLCAAAQRLERRGAPPIQEIGLALAASIGFLIKPHFLLVPFLVEGLIWVKNGMHINRSAFVIAGMSALYFAAAWQLTPEYLPLARMLREVYAFGFLGTPPLSFATEPNFHVGLLGLLVAAVLRLRGAAVFAMASVGFGAAALSQFKGWSYHWYPFAALGWLLIALALGRLLTMRWSNIIAGSMCALSLVIANLTWHFKNPFDTALTPVLTELGGGATLILTPIVRVSYPMLTRPGFQNPWRLPVAQLLFAAAYKGQKEHEALLQNIVVADFLREPPRIIVAESHPPEFPNGFDVIAYLSQDPDFARAMQAYRPVRQIGAFRIYTRDAAKH